MLGRVYWGGNIGLRKMVSLRDRPDPGGSARCGWSIWGVGLDFIWNRMGCIWWEGGHIGNEKCSVEIFGSKTSCISELVDFFYRSIYSSEKSGLNHNSPIKSR